MRILIAPDKFKGTLTAAEAARAIAAGWAQSRPGDRLDLLPISDGGDGFGEVMGSLMKARECSTPTLDAAHRACRAHWWWKPATGTAIIESATAIGLTMLPTGRFHPFELDTYGLGTVIRAASAIGAKRCIIGIGGSATNDGGFGLSKALGWRFLDSAGECIDQWTDLPSLHRIRPPDRRCWFGELLVAVDVRNPLLGSRGASRVYGRQKGLKPGDMTFAENCLRRLAFVVEEQFGGDVGRMPGAGAAGGLGFGLSAFLGGRLEPGFALFSRRAQLPRRIAAADLVITGEGRTDESTWMGKGVGCLASMCRKEGVQCVGLAGVVSGRKKGFLTLAMTNLTSEAEARSNPKKWLGRAAAELARTILRWQSK